MSDYGTRFPARFAKFVEPDRPKTPGHWKRFYDLETDEAVAWAAAGNKALLTRPKVGYLYDADLDRLLRTARSLGCKKPGVQNRGREGQHVGLQGVALERAMDLCSYHERNH